MKRQSQACVFLIYLTFLVSGAMDKPITQNAPIAFSQNERDR